MSASRSRRPLRFATFLAPIMLPVYQFLADRIAGRLGQPVELVVGTSFRQFEQGDADLGVICGLPYVWLTARRPPPVQPLAAPVLAGERYAGRPVYYSDVIVHRDSPIDRLERLRGCSWAYNDPASHSGYTVTLHALLHMGARPGFFGRVVRAGLHERALQLVARGEIDASAIDSQVLAVALHDQPQLAASPPEQTKSAVRDTLLELARDKAARATLGHGFVERFVAIHDTAYDDIRAMLATVQAAGYTTLR